MIVKISSHSSTRLYTHHPCSKLISNGFRFIGYIKNRKDLRAYPFLSIAEKDFEFVDKNMEKGIWRYKELSSFIKNLDARSIVRDEEGDMVFKRKQFYDLIF